ncbi:GNAT family N-acetyltransferase [Streptomyces sp. C1-2]|uniref:GNAT family N-acetyltransferase n=1 Tax=Streptomyces sp. C1-2 TaxID=2720022 RepID=UPI0019D0524F|nr:GNAT family N-acetyltransferase [Streptomyces sp. C1-2]
MQTMGGEQVTEALAHAVSVLEAGTGRDWAGTKAGALEWSCRYTAQHVADTLIAYAGRLATGARRRVPFDTVLLDEADNAAVLDVLRTTGALLSAAIATAPREARAYHGFPYGSANREGFAAMGVTEVLLHTHDIATGLGLPYEPPEALCRGVLERIFPHVRPGHAPWPTLRWATGRGDLPGRAPVAEWEWRNNLVIPAARLTLQGITPAAAADLAVGGPGGFAWVGDGPYEGEGAEEAGTRTAAGMLRQTYEAGTHRPEWGMFALVRREDGRAVGAMGFHGPPDEEGRVEVGYDLAPSARGHGYATEALRALASWAAAREDVRTVFAKTAPANTASQAVLTRAGFTRVPAEGVLRLYELLG